MFEQVQARRWINAGIPDRYSRFTFETFDALSDEQREGKIEARDMCLLMADGNAIDYQGKIKNCLLLFGSTGMGKSGLMAAIAQAWVQREISVVWTDFLEFIEAIRKSYEGESDLSASAIVERAQNAPLLCLDDLGDMDQDRKVSDHTREKLYAVIRHRHVNNMATVFTSNLSQPAMAIQFGKRITDRIFEMAHDVRLKGVNLRFA